MRFSTSLLGLVAATTAVVLSIVSATHEAATADDSVTMYVGGYTRNEGWVNGQSKGVYTFTFFPGNGTLKEKSVIAAGINPTFLRGTKVASSGKKQFLYATNECSETSKDVPGTTTGYVVAMEVTATGLKVLNQRETRGSQPAHVSVSPNEDFIAISMYGGGGVVMYPIKTDGSLDTPSDSHFYTGGSKVGASQDAAHLHSTTWVSGSNVVFAADLGNDQIVQYTLNAGTKKLVNTTLPIIKRPPGSGPRHMALHPTGKIAYVVDEISNTIGVYQLNSDKSLPKNVAQTISTLPAGYTQASSSADICVSDDGNFVYSSNRGHNSIAVFKVVSQTIGTLQLVGFESSRGDGPRSFVLYKNFLIVANMNSNNIVVFQRNADGTLTYSGNSVANPTPSSLFIPAV